MKSTMRLQLLNSQTMGRWNVFPKVFPLLPLALLLLFSPGWPREVLAMGRARPVAVGEHTYWPVPLIARELDLSYQNYDEKRFSLSGRNLDIRLEVGGRRAMVNGVLVWLHEPVVAGRRSPMLSVSDVETVLLPLARPIEALRQVGYRTIVLDAGHGGADPGGQGPAGSIEKELALTLTKGVADVLREAGLDVYLTRDDDSALTLSNRVVRTRDAGADLFVSLHFNTSANPQAQGSETFVLTAGGHASTSGQSGGSHPPEVDANAFDAANLLLGYAIQQRLLQRTGNQDRGVRRARFFVLREAVSPAVLVEAAFLTNAEEEVRVMDPAFQARMIRGIAEGILDYTSLVMRAQLEEYL